MADSGNKPHAFKLQALHDKIWGKPESLVQAATPDPHTDETLRQATTSTNVQICEILDIQEHEDSLLPLGFCLHSCLHGQLMVTQQYKDVLQYLKQQLSPGTVSPHGFAILGQPGIGKSMFLLYVFLKCMEEALPVAIQKSDTTYYLVNDQGISLYNDSDTDPSPLDAHKSIWCLSDSGDNRKVPLTSFHQTSSHVRVIQAASPQKDCWLEWTECHDGRTYMMDTFSEGELGFLGFLSGGLDNVSKIIDLSHKWGPSPRNLLKILDDPINGANNVTHRIIDAANKLAQDPDTVLASVAPFAENSFASPVLWLRSAKTKDCPGDFHAYVPNATKIVQAVRQALQARSAVDVATFFNKVSHNANSRSLAGHLFEMLTHVAATSDSEPFTWHMFDDSSKEDVSPVSSQVIISSVSDLKNAKAPFYFQPAQTNFPGIDGALFVGKYIYTIQATVSATHTSALPGLQKLYDGLPSSSRPPKQNWHILFASPDLTVGKRLAQDESKKLGTDHRLWKSIKIGYFNPLSGTPTFNALIEPDPSLKGKGRAIEPEMPQQTPLSTRTRRKHSLGEEEEMPEASTSSIHATGSRKKPKSKFFF